MARIRPIKERRFRTVGEDGYDYHLIDQGGNHFINGVCVNPDRSELILHPDGVWRHMEVGDTYPDQVLPWINKID